MKKGAELFKEEDEDYKESVVEGEAGTCPSRLVDAGLTSS